MWSSWRTKLRSPVTLFPAVFLLSAIDSLRTARAQESSVRVGWRSRGDNPRMAQGKRISADIPGDVLQSIRDLGAAARLARTGAGEGQAAAAARLGVHVQTI